MNRKEIAIIALIIFLTVISWVVFDVYHVQKKSTISPKEIRQVIPLTPTFDSDILKRLQNREE